MTECSFYFFTHKSGFSVPTLKYIHPQQMEGKFVWNQYLCWKYDWSFFYIGLVKENSQGHKCSPAPLIPMQISGHTGDTSKYTRHFKKQISYKMLYPSRRLLKSRSKDGFRSTPCHAICLCHLQ